MKIGTCCSVLFREIMCEQMRFFTCESFFAGGPPPPPNMDQPLPPMQGCPGGPGDFPPPGPPTPSGGGEFPSMGDLPPPTSQPSAQPPSASPDFQSNSGKMIEFLNEPRQISCRESIDN